MFGDCARLQQQLPRGKKEEEMNTVTKTKKKMSTVIEKLARYAAEFRPFTFYSAYFLC